MGHKIISVILSIFLLSAAVFYMARLAPGDPLVSYYGDRAEKMSPKEREWAEDKLGLKDPVTVQYVRWLGRAFHGDFGISYTYKTDVLEVIKERVGNTLVLGGIGLFLTIGLSLLLGVLCAWQEDGMSTAGRPGLTWRISSTVPSLRQLCRASAAPYSVSWTVISSPPH